MPRIVSGPESSSRQGLASSETIPECLLHLQDSRTSIEDIIASWSFVETGSVVQESHACIENARTVAMSQFVGKTRLAYSRVWHHVDLAEEPRPYGRLASSIALTLMGKHKPIYDPSTDCGDYVVVTNCAQLHTTGKKREQKKYYTHTTRPGSLKSMTMDKLMAKWGGGEILARAVKGMLPKNRLQDDRLARLKCFEGSAHPYGQNLLKDHTLTQESPSSILENPEVQATLSREAQRATPAA